MQDQECFVIMSNQVSCESMTQVQHHSEGLAASSLYLPVHKGYLIILAPFFIFLLAWTVKDCHRGLILSGI